MAGLLEKTGDLVIVVAIIGVAWLLIQIKYFGFKKIKKNRNDMKLRFLEHASTAVILIVGLVVAFSTLGGVTFMVKSMLGGTAFFSAIIAFMAQDVVKDILAALMISIYQPFEIGDRIELEDGEAGVVEDVTMRHIVLVGQDTLRIVIPNRRLADMKIRNFSYNIDCRSRLFTFEIAYPSDVEFAIRVIKQAIMDSDYSIPGKKTKTGMEYGPVYFMAFESSSLLLKTMVYYLPSTSTEVMTTDINLRVDQALWENGIEIPYPHVNVLPTDPEVKDHRPNECPERVWKTPVIEMDTRDKEKMPLSLERALDETARLGQDNGLNKGEISRLRLLGEELVRMMPEIVGDVDMKYWTEHKKRQYRIHVSADVYMTREIRKSLLSVSSTDKNAANQSFTEQMRAVISDMASDRNIKRSSVARGDDDGGTGRQNVYRWSMRSFKSSVEDVKKRTGETDMTWQELEKSIIVRIADDVSISIMGTSVEIIAFKSFE